ncbi:uncharacterized, partial [Tachysurus ichikawai]
MSRILRNTEVTKVLHVSEAGNRFVVTVSQKQESNHISVEKPKSHLDSSGATINALIFHLFNASFCLALFIMFIVSCVNRASALIRQDSTPPSDSTFDVPLIDWLGVRVCAEPEWNQRTLTLMRVDSLIA